MAEMARAAYAAAFGPTATDRPGQARQHQLMTDVTEDRLVHGEEITTGGGKGYRDGMGMSGATRHLDGALDLVIYNALVIDPVIGIVKGDIGVREGRIVGIGKAGNPDVMDGVPISSAVRPR